MKLEFFAIRPQEANLTLKVYTKKQIISILKKYETGMSVGGLARSHDVVENTIYRRRSKTGRHGGIRSKACSGA